MAEDTAQQYDEVFSISKMQFLLYHNIEESLLLQKGQHPLPPGRFITDSFDNEGVFTLPATPGFIVLVIMRVRTPTPRTGCSYFSGGLLIQFLPVVIRPSRSNRHCILR